MHIVFVNMTADETFERLRPYLRSIAYRMLGSIADAEDVVQDAWLRWHGTDRNAVVNPAAWLTTTATRLALDRIRTLSRRREEYVGPWLPEPVAVTADPEAAMELAESMTLGFLVVLDSLSATERAVFLLADVFGEPFAAIAAAVGKSEDNCRQIATRARRKVRAARPPEVQSADANVLAQLLVATATGDVDGVLGLLDTDVVLLSDGGATRRAARRPVVGPGRVARFLINLGHRVETDAVEFRTVNGDDVVVFHLPDGLLVIDGDVRDGKLVAIRAQRNPDKLTHVEEPTTLR